MLGNNKLDSKKKYTAIYEFTHFVTTRENCYEPDYMKRKIFTVEKSWCGYPHDIAQAVKYYMGHYGAIQGKLLGEMNEITNKKS